MQIVSLKRSGSWTSRTPSAKISLTLFKMAPVSSIFISGGKLSSESVKSGYGSLWGKLKSAFFLDGNQSVLKTVSNQLLGPCNSLTLLDAVYQKHSLCVPGGGGGHHLACKLICFSSEPENLVMIILPSSSVRR